MATATLNPVIISISGRIDGIVFYRRKETQCIRTYVVPRNADTVSQRNIRSSFAQAVKGWQALASEEKYKYARKARGANMSGYNLYISEYMKEKISVESNPEVKQYYRGLIKTYGLQKRIRSVSASIVNSFGIINAPGRLYCYCDPG